MKKKEFIGPGTVSAGLIVLGSAILLYMQVLEPGAFPNTWGYAFVGALILLVVGTVRLLNWIITIVKRAFAKGRPENLFGAAIFDLGEKAKDVKTSVSAELKTDVENKGFQSQVVWWWLSAVLFLIWWLVFGHSGGQSGSETGLFRNLAGIFAGWWIDAVIGVFMVLVGITAVYLSRKVTTIPCVTPIGDPAASILAPEPRDVMERQLQTMGFHYLGDFDATMMSSVQSRLRAYCDPDRQAAAAIVDITSEKKTTTILQFGTDLHPSGSIVTSTSSFPSIYARPPGRIMARVPWKNTAAEVFKLHQLLCRTAREEHFEAETVHAATLAENVRKSERLECEYQVKIGRLKQIAEDKYRMTLLGTIIAVPLVLWQMVYGSSFSWVKMPDSFFCWKLRRCLGRLVLSIRIQSEWASCEQSRDEIDTVWLEDLVDDLIRRGATPWISLGYGNPAWPGGGTEKADSPLPGSEALSGWDAYVETIARKMKGRVRTWEIWNEPNHPKRRIEPAVYAEFVVRTAKILRSVDPKACIRFGATAGIDVEYTKSVLATLRELDGLGLVNELTVHPHAPNPNIPWQGKAGMRELWVALRKADPRLRLVKEE